MTIKFDQTPEASEVIEFIGRLSSFDANRILKSDTSVFTNAQYSGADDFTDSNGVMNTLDTGNSTALYESTLEAYVLKFTDESSGDTTHDPDSFTDVANAFVNNDSTFAVETITTTGNPVHELGKTFSSKFVGWVKIKMTATGSDSNTITVKLQTFNGSSWDDVTTLDTATGNPTSVSFDSIHFLDSTTEGVRVEFVYSGGNNQTFTSKLFTLEYGDFDASATVETNSIVTDAVPKSIVIYTETTLPTNTSITVDISDDGGSTFSITGKSFDTYIDTTSFSGSNLALKFNLATTDDTVTPRLFGYGVAITDS